MQKLVTIKTIAKEMGLSLSAVSKALNDYPDINEDTKKSVVDKALELGYSPNLMARNLVKNTSNTIGVIVRDVSTIYGETFKYLGEKARENGQFLIMCDTQRNEELEIEYVKSMIESRVCGLVIVPTKSDIERIKSLVNLRVPVVYLGGRVTDENENFVAVDCNKGTLLAMDYLFGLGHRNIALLCDARKSFSTTAKVKTYREYMRSHGLQASVFMDDDDSKDLVSIGYELAQRAMNDAEQHSAFFCIKDLLAVGAMKAIKDRGFSIPEDYSVIGYDGSEISALPMIELTTIAQRKKDMADEVMNILGSQVRVWPDAVAQHRFVEPDLVVRKSCRSLLG